MKQSDCAEIKPILATVADLPDDQVSPESARQSPGGACHSGRHAHHNIQSLLGASLAAQARVEEVEPLTVGAYQGLSQRQIAIPRDSWWALDQAAERIVQLYRAWGRTQQAAEWSRKLEPEISAAHHK